MLFLHLHLACASENRMDTLNKHLGSSFHFLCKSTLCNAVKHNYTHYDQITGKPDLVKQSSTFTQKLSSFEHGGKYCCHNHCGDDKTNVSISRVSDCCFNVASKTNDICVTVTTYAFIHATVVVPTTVQWDLPKAVALNGDPVTGSCSASGYPRPDIKVFIPLCNYQLNNVHIGRYTTKAVFTMNITRNCDKIYCLIGNILRTSNLLIVGKCAW